MDSAGAINWCFSWSSLGCFVGLLLPFLVFPVWLNNADSVTALNTDNTWLRIGAAAWVAPALGLVLGLVGAAAGAQRALRARARRKSWELVSFVRSKSRARRDQAEIARGLGARNLERAHFIALAGVMVTVVAFILFVTVRTLAGDAAFHLPYGGINRSHYDVALETLRNLDWVVPLESTHKKIVLTAGLGWQGDEPSVFSDLGALEGAAAEASSELWKSIQDSIAESSLAIQEAVDSSPEAMEAAEAVKDAAETVKDAAEAVKDAATDSLDVVQDAAASSIESVLESTKAIQDAAIESLDSEAAETVKDAAEAVQDAATDSLDVVQEAAASSLDAVLESTKAIEHAAIESLDGAIESLDSVVKGEGGAQEAVFMSDAITGRGARRRTQNIFSPSSQNDGKVNIDQHASWYAPFTDSDKELLTKLNRFDIALRAEADRLHALDLVSLEQLARHYPAAVLPSKPSQPATSCCGYTCVNTDKQVNDGRGPQAAVRVLVTWAAVVAAAAAAACAALLTRRGAMERGAHVLT